ncbi:vacuolar protein sorting-associated protein 28 homolog [Alca torda]
MGKSDVSVKETLESSLLEAQQHLSELEIARSHLEIQLHTVAQVKEVIQGEVKCLQWELEAERSLLKLERENMAQELLQKEQQHNDTLKLRETDHKVEINKLLQDVLDCPLAMDRIKEDRLITSKDDKGNLNRCIAHIVSLRCRGSAAVVLGAASLFITVMDKLRLEMRAMDEVGCTHPELRELMETMNCKSHPPPDLEGRQKVNQWLQTLSRMSVSDDLDNSWVRQMLFNLESTCNAFNCFLHS